MSPSPCATAAPRTSGLPRKSPTQAGVEVSATPAATANPLKFTGQYQDSTVGGDYFMRARMYDAGTGTFNGIDPVRAGVGEPAMSPYAYVDGHVLRAVDPTGESLGDWLSDVGSKIDAAADKVGSIGEEADAEAAQWTKETVTGALKTYEKLDDASATSVGTPKSKQKAAQNDLKEAYKPKNILNSFKAGYEEDAGNPVRQVTRGVLDVGSLLIGGGGAVKAGAKAGSRAGAKSGATGAGAGGTTTIYRGSTYGSAMEVVQSKALDVARVQANQRNMPPARGPGVYLTSQESTARYYANLHGGGGPGPRPRGVEDRPGPDRDPDSVRARSGIRPHR